MFFSKTCIPTLAGKPFDLIMFFLFKWKRKEPLYFTIQITNKFIGNAVIFYCNKTYCFISLAQSIHKGISFIDIMAKKIGKVYHRNCFHKSKFVIMAKYKLLICSIK